VTEEAYYAMVREFLFLTFTGKSVGDYELWRDREGTAHSIQSPKSIPFEERRRALEEKAAAMLIELPPISKCN